MTTSREHPLHILAMEIRYDLTAAQGKLTELMRQIAELELPMPDGTQLTDCPHCGPIPGGPRKLAEHLYNHHDGPAPAHYLDIEARSEQEAA